jgi:hypothetical protein
MKNLIKMMVLAALFTGSQFVLGMDFEEDYKQAVSVNGSKSVLSTLEAKPLQQYIVSLEEQIEKETDGSVTMLLCILDDSKPRHERVKIDSGELIDLLDTAKPRFDVRSVTVPVIIDTTKYNAQFVCRDGDAKAAIEAYYKKSKPKVNFKQLISQFTAFSDQLQSAPLPSSGTGGKKHWYDFTIEKFVWALLIVGIYSAAYVSWQAEKIH